LTTHKPNLFRLAHTHFSVVFTHVSTHVSEHKLQSELDSAQVLN